MGQNPESSKGLVHVKINDSDKAEKTIQGELIIFSINGTGYQDEKQKQNFNPFLSPYIKTNSEMDHGPMDLNVKSETIKLLKKK